MPATPKVFISYSHDNDAHKARVLAFADRLRNKGLAVMIDQYVQFPPEGWPLWCEKQIDGADFVLMVCTEVYLRRVRNEEIPGTGLGVLWEAQLIRQELYDSGSVSAKFVPVRFADGSDAHIPRPVRRFSRYIVDLEAEYEALYRYLTDQPATPPPRIGEREELPRAARPGLTDAPVVAGTTKSAEPALSQPHPRVEDVFAGRQAELHKLAECLFPASGKRRPVAVLGMGGVGKSYLVDRFYWENAARFPGGYVRVALEPEKPVTADDLLASIAERLKLPAADQGALAARLLTPLTLLHVENIDTLEAGTLIGGVVNRLVGCALVASARLKTLGVGGGWGRVEVGPLDEAPALDQLAQELGDDAPARENLLPLVQALGRLPLALHLAAGYLRMGDSPEMFLDRLRGKGLALGPIDPSDPTFHERSREVLAKTFELSLDALGLEGGERALHWRAAFDALGYAPAAGFGESLGAAIADLPLAEFRSLTLAAVRLSLLERVVRSGGGNAFRLHPLLAELGRAGAKKDPVIDRMTEWFVERLPEGGEDQGRRWGEVHDETAALIEWLPQVPGPDRGRIVKAAIQYAVTNGPFHAWTGFCEEAVAEEQDEDARLNVLWVLVQVALRSGLPDRGLAVAEEMHQFSLQVGAEQWAAVSAGFKADVLQARGDLDGALKIRREEQLPVYERLGDVREKAVTMGRIADVLQARGDLDGALKIRREELLPVYERLGDVREKAVTMGKIADVLQARGDLDGALKIRREEELPVYERLGDVSAKAVTMGKIADVLQARGDLDGALKIRREEELPVYERLGDVREKAVTMGKIADVLQARGDLDGALKIRREEELPVYERLGDVSAKALTMGKIADVLGLQGQMDEAVRIPREEQLPVLERLGDVPALLRGRRNLAITLLRRDCEGDREEARRLLRSALDDARRLKLPEASWIEQFLERNGLSCD